MSSASMQRCESSKDSGKRFQLGDCCRHFVQPDSRRADEKEEAHTVCVKNILYLSIRPSGIAVNGRGLHLFAFHVINKAPFQYNQFLAINS
jgi:hypothetical protein